MFKRILVTLDGSTLAERAIPHAEQFSRIFGSDIILLMVLDPNANQEKPIPIDPLSWQIRKAEADLYMNGIAARVRENLRGSSVEQKNLINIGGEGKSTNVEYAIREGKPAENIVNFAHEENIDLLMISSHGSGGLSRWNISSVTQKVINLVYLPVLIVRAYQQPAMEDGKIHYRRLLLPIDSSRRAEFALSAGIALVRGEISMGLPSEINNLTVLPPLPKTDLPQPKVILAAVLKPPELPIPEPYPVEIEKLSNQLMQASHQTVGNYLQKMKERLEVECEICIIENKSVSAAIQEIANQADEIDLVVLCAHGFTGQTTNPYGNVARNYMEHGTRPVLIIQDVLRSQVKSTAAEIAAEKSGGS